jgi:ABC-type cobalamin/Fe3+-siderophores transport system ATPase subunit
MKIADHTLMLSKQSRYFYGRTGDVVNADNMRAAFSVNVLVNSVEIGDRQYDSIVPVSVVWPPERTEQNQRK